MRLARTSSETKLYHSSLLVGPLPIADWNVHSCARASAVNETCHRKLFYCVLGLEYDRDGQLVAFAPPDISLLSAELSYGLIWLFPVQSLQAAYKLDIYLLMMHIVHALT